MNTKALHVLARHALALALLASLTQACDEAPPPADADAGPASTDAGPVITEGRPLAAEDFCAELTAVVCGANTDCCGGAVGYTDGEALACDSEQLAACEETVESLLDDPRTAYVPERGGAFMDALAERADGCFAEPPRLAELLAVFGGTGGANADCTPPSLGDRDLLISQLSCADGLTCHLYRRTEGATLGVCEPREDDACSHRFDCLAGQFCNLPDGWEPGRWGACQPERTNGWDCDSDLECASQHCDRSGVCAAAGGERYCAATTYPGEVLADAALGYWRLGSSTPTDERGGPDGSFAGTPSAATGAIAHDSDGAMGLDGADDAAYLPEVGALLSGRAFSLELWFTRTAESVTGPLLEFGAPEELGVRVWNHDGADKVHFNARDDAETNHGTTSAEGIIAADTWYHVVATYDGAVGRLYVNGERVGEDIEGSFTPLVRGPLRVGIREADERHILGAIDEVAIYDRALPRSLIQRHTRLGRDGPSPQDFVLFRALR